MIALSVFKALPDTKKNMVGDIYTYIYMYMYIST